ncbi:MAG: MMPL family transporter, partial [Planctomycetota bacterium]
TVSAMSLGSLGASQIVPIQKFGVFTAAGVLATVLVLLTILPLSLHLFPPKLPGDEGGKPGGDNNSPASRRRTPKRRQPLPAWAAAWARFVTHRPGLVAACCLSAMAVFAYGLTKTDTEVRLLKLLDPGTSLIRDYAWFEEHLGNLVPMEVVVTLGKDQLREPNELADAGDRYRMTMFERLTLVQRLQQRIESLEPVSRAISAATFGPTDRPIRSKSERLAVNSATSDALEQSREDLREYLAREVEQAEADSQQAAVVGGLASDKAKPTGRELWRISARVAALSDVDYGDFVGDLQRQVEPVLDVYRLRDKLQATLRAQDKPLVGARVLVVFDGPAGATRPAEGSDARLLTELLTESGVPWNVRGRRGRLRELNAQALRTVAATPKSDPEAGDADASNTEAEGNAQVANNAAAGDRYRRILSGYDALVTTSPTAAAAVRAFLGEDSPAAAPNRLVTLAQPGAQTAAERSDANLALKPGDSLSAVYTGIVPLVYKTQRELLASLQTSIGWATVLIACVMFVVLRSPGGGIVSMIPNVFPVVSVFGSLGWLGVKIDIGIMMTASVALGVAVDDTIHFLTWFRRGIVQGLDRRSATLLAFDRCAVAMTQTTLIAGLGLAVFATSTFTPTQQFGYLMITMLGAALVGDLVMLPAILCGPLGRFFAPGAPPTPEHAAGADRAAGAAGEAKKVIESDAPTGVPTAPSDAIPSSAAPPAHAGDLRLDPGRGEEGPTILPIGAAGDGGSSGDTPDPDAGDSVPHEPRTQEPLSPGNAALRERLRKFRRP